MENNVILHKFFKMEDNYKNNMIFGVHPVSELIRSQKEIEKVFIQAGTRSPEISEIANYCRANEIPVQYVPMEKMNRLTRKNHQGVIAFICPIEYQPLEKVVQMVFEEGRQHTSLYGTPFGELTVDIQTSRLRHNLTERGGVMEIRYSIAVEHVVTGKNCIKVRVRRK